MSSVLARAAIDRAFERAVEDLFAELHKAPTRDQDAPVRFANGVQKLTETRIAAMELIDSPYVK